jgi:hypothetical protein
MGAKGDDSGQKQLLHETCTTAMIHGHFTLNLAIFSN